MVEDRDIDSLVNELSFLQVRVSQVEAQLRERRAREEGTATLPTITDGAGRRNCDASNDTDGAGRRNCDASNDIDDATASQASERRSSANYQQNQTTSELACTLGRAGHRKRTKSNSDPHRTRPSVDYHG